MDRGLFNRPEDFKTRRPKQIKTPPFPTTSIGSFPQTAGEFFGGFEKWLGQHFMWFSRQKPQKGQVQSMPAVFIAVPILCGEAVATHCSMKQMLRLAGLKYNAALLVITNGSCVVQRSGGHVCSTRRGSYPMRTMRSR